MIMLKDNAILVIGQDGRSTPFEPEDLQTRIIKCCLASGNKDVWIAQDISLSIEYALVSRAGDGPATVRVAELESLVAKILEETGYHDVAERFRGSAPKEDSLMAVSDAESLRDLISKRLSLSGPELDTVESSLLQALKALDLERCPPQLAIELARHYKDSLGSSAPSLKSPALKPLGKKDGKSFLLEPCELLAGLPSEMASLAARGVVAPRPLSRLFPVLALDLRLVPFAELNGFEKPFTELSLAPKLGALGSAVEAIAAKAERLCAEAGRSDCLPLPVWLNMADISQFCSEWLGYAPEGVAKASSELALAVLAPISRTPFKTTLI